MDVARIRYRNAAAIQNWRSLGLCIVNQCPNYFISYELSRLQARLDVRLNELREYQRLQAKMAKAEQNRHAAERIMLRKTQKVGSPTSTRVRGSVCQKEIKCRCTGCCVKMNCCPKIPPPTCKYRVQYTRNTVQP
ncbi:unnamed protein product [Calicophoron daubneyi]|uniref:Uncharacterized protein n=1 Tax=Calicophoron daubneyi TaxID=300641 RepID=A0AAV2TEY6_CALDB